MFSAPYTRSLVVLLLFAMLGGFTSPQAALSLRMEGVQSSKGQILVTLYNKEDGFPNDPETAVRTLAASAQKGVTVITIDGLTAGEYAVGILHDENADGIMNTNFWGAPKEGWGVSNNAKGFLGAPDYGDCTFQLQGNKTISITLRY